MSIVTIQRRLFSSLPPIEVEIGAEFDNASAGVRLGAAVRIFVGKAATEGKTASLNGASLDGASLDDASLNGANLDGASLNGANLDGASLDRASLDGASLNGASLNGASLDRASLNRASLNGASLDRASLDAIRADFFGRMVIVKAEVPGLLAALRAGQINGSAYTGECACFMGTIANVRGCGYEEIPGLKPDAHSPTERFFLAIKKGDTPATNPVAKIVEGWILEFQAMIGQVQPEGASLSAPEVQP